VCCSVLQCVAVCCSVLQCVAVCCSVLQCVAVCCSVLPSDMRAAMHHSSNSNQTVYPTSLLSTVYCVQPVPWKMRLGMIVEMQIEILNGGEILVTCKKLNSQFEFVLGDTEEFKINFNLYREILMNLSFSISTS